MILTCCFRGDEPDCQEDLERGTTKAHLRIVLVGDNVAGEKEVAFGGCPTRMREAVPVDLIKIELSVLVAWMSNARKENKPSEMKQKTKETGCLISRLEQADTHQERQDSRRYLGRNDGEN